MPTTEKNANAFDMTTLSAVNSGYSLMLINNSTNEGQLIRMTDLATMILNEGQDPDDIINLINSLEDRIATIQGGNPEIVDNVSAMTDTDKIYILSTDSKWYYYSLANSEWTIGGTYGGVPTDTTLTQPGMAADAEKVGDALGEIGEDISDNHNAILTVGDAVNDITNIIKRPPLYASRVPDYAHGDDIRGMDVVFRGTKVFINGTPDASVVLEADADRATDGVVYYRMGITSTFLDDIAAHPRSVTPGRYRIVFNMLSGSVTKNESHTHLMRILAAQMLLMHFL